MNTTEVDDSNMEINMTISDAFIDSSILNVTYSNGSLFYTNTTTLNQTIILDNIIVLDNYTISLYVNDTSGNSNLTNVTFESFDTIVPSVNNLTLSPINNSIVSSVSLVQINYNVTDKYYDNTTFEFDGIPQTITFIDGIYYINVSAVSIGTHNYTIFVNDSNGNLNYLNYSYILRQDDIKTSTGSSSGGYTCTPKWTCNDWGDCNSTGSQIRECTNSVTNCDKLIPDTIQSCIFSEGILYTIDPIYKSKHVEAGKIYSDMYKIKVFDTDQIIGTYKIWSDTNWITFSGFKIVNLDIKDGATLVYDMAIPKTLEGENKVTIMFDDGYGNITYRTIILFIEDNVNIIDATKDIWDNPLGIIKSNNFTTNIGLNDPDNMFAIIESKHIAYGAGGIVFIVVSVLLLITMTGNSSNKPKKKRK